MDRDQLNELLYQAYETELGGEKLYRKAIECAVNDDVREEWEKYLEETITHQDKVEEILAAAGLDPQVDTAGRQAIRIKAEALVAAMDTARTEGGPIAGQLAAAESIVEAESKDFANWELIGKMAEHATGDLAKVMKAKHEEVSEEEAEHLFHTMGWARELWLDSLGVPAVLPPPEEEKSVKTQIGAARAEQQRDEYL
jgi:rubrerythrin